MPDNFGASKQVPNLYTGVVLRVEKNRMIDMMPKKSKKDEIFKKNREIFENK